MKIILFPGQGTQNANIENRLLAGQEEKLSIFEHVMGRSLLSLIGQDCLSQTEYAQPYIFSLSVLSWNHLTTEQEMLFMGHSLGEYAALVAAGVLSFADGLQIVQHRAELMGAQRGGAMSAVIGLEESSIQESLSEEVVIANYNTPSQFVISGRSSDVGHVSKRLTNMGAKVIPLPVSGAFHSPMMQQAKEAFYQTLKGYSFDEAHHPIILNKTARCFIDQTQEWPTLLSEQLTSPVFWTQSVQYCLALGGIETIEMAPGTVLTGLFQSCCQ